MMRGRGKGLKELVELEAVYIVLGVIVEATVSRGKGAARRPRSDECCWAEPARGVGVVLLVCRPHIRSSGGRRAEMRWGARQEVPVVLKIEPGMLARPSHAVKRCRCFVAHLLLTVVMRSRKISAIANGASGRD